MRAVVALGGNALARRGGPLDTASQRARVRLAAAAVAELAREHELVLTHGNGPQIGLLALQAESCSEVPAPPLDVLGAQSEGLIGYLIDQELSALLPGREVVALLTQVEVDPADPAFASPSKPIGPSYPEARARALAAQRGWALVRDGSSFRRAIASPEPRRIRELRAIRLLLEAGVIVVCAGGGGIPVAVAPDGGLRGVEAVIDKDLASALLASALGAEALLLLTDVPAVFEDWPEPARRPLRRVAPSELRRLRFEPGSMAPKVEAACRFVEAGGGFAAIGALEDAARLLAGEAGTRVALGRGPGRRLAPAPGAQISPRR
jgi:carbamate kinase